LNADDQRAWNSVSPEGRELIAKFFDKKGKDNITPPAPSRTANSLSLKVLEQELEPIENPCSELDKHQDEEEDGSPTEEAALILKRAQQETSGRKFMTHFLGKKSPKTPTPRNINCTKTISTVSNAASMDDYETGGLVDREAWWIGREGFESDYHHRTLGRHYRYRRYSG
jgi:hypothetical protein